MWNVTGSHEDMDFPYIPLLHQDIWTDNNNDGVFLHQKKNCWNKRKVIFSQVCFVELSQEINQWDTHSSPVDTFHSFKRHDGFIGRTSSLVDNGYGTNLSTAILQAAKIWASA